MNNSDTQIIKQLTGNKTLISIAEKVLNNERISDDEALTLFSEAELPYLMHLATFKKKQLSEDKVYFNKNFHIEPTNICIYRCTFCSYRRNIGDEDAWDYSIDKMLEIVESFDDKDVTEVHIVGGVHPKHDIYFYTELLKKIKVHRPNIHIKAFTAIELEFMIKKAKLPLEEGLKILKESGLDSIPGGGAEIFNWEIRKKICKDKGKAEKWLEIHRIAHKLGIASNATILYGHIESYKDRIDHMHMLRHLQDETNGFNAFIPLKYKKEHNQLSHIGEVSIIEDLKNFAVSRLYLDNIKHIKAYWPMLGKEEATLALFAGADDMDGTIDDTTKIYSMAGSEEQSPTMTVEEITTLIKNAGYTPVERDSLYNEIKKHL